MILLRQLIIVNLCAAEVGAGFKDGVAGIRKQHTVAGIQQGHAQMSHTLLGAVDTGDHGRGNVYAVAALVIAHHTAQQLLAVHQ